MTITQKITNIVKSPNIFKAKEYDTHLELDSKGSINVLVYSDKAESPYYSKFLSGTGMLDFRAGRSSLWTGYARRENTRGGVRSVLVDYDVIVNDEEYHAEMGGLKATRAFRVEESDLGDHMDMSVLTELKPGYASMSQTRTGDLVFISTETDTLKYLQNLGFIFEAWYKRKNGKVFFDAVKSFKRTKLSASAGKKLKFLEGFKLLRKENKAYTGIDKHGNDTTVTAKVYVVTDGDRFYRIEVVPQDFEVRVEQEGIFPSFASDTGGVKIVKSEKTFMRQATDGIVYVDAKMALALGLFTSAQFRLTPVGKGFAAVTPGLVKQTGSDMILFGGAVKGDIEQYFDRNEFDFYILNKARATKERNSLLLSRQVFGALGVVSPGILQDLKETTKDILTRAYNFEEEALLEFVGVEEVVEGEDEEVLDIDNLTVALLKAGGETYLKSAFNRRSVASLVRASTGQIERAGKLFVPDAEILHMVVDPYAIISFLSKGLMGIDAATVDKVGIAPGHLIKAATTNGYNYVEHKKAFLARYPFLHHLEGQIVNESGDAFVDERSAKYYMNTVAGNYFMGLAIYSLYDLIAEGQSGADFDGDTTVYITNPIVTDHIIKQPLFLDYSFIDGELVEGVPWKGGGSTPNFVEAVGVEKVRELEAMGVKYDKGVFSFNEELVGNEYLERAMAEAMANIAALMNSESNIGKFTNINSSVMELELIFEKLLLEIDSAEQTPELVMARYQVQKERDGYKKLSFLMAAAIRWEIDKAKHGGEFMEKLGFLKLMIDGVDSESGRADVREAEVKFGVSLERLFFGNRK